MVDYTALSGPQLLAATNVAAWVADYAAAYVRHVEKRVGVKPDQEQALTMAMEEYLRPDAMPVVLPDGSAFLLAIGGTA